jgi:hypothetical protein
MFMNQSWAFDLVPDLKVALNGRSYPIGAQVVSSAGLGVSLWGDTRSWKYGFARVALNGATSVVVNRIGAEFQLFPVSILGVSAGFDSGTRNFGPRFVNCGQYECTGRVDRLYLKGQLFAGYKKIILNFNVRSETLHSYETSKPFYDELTLLHGHSNGERLLMLNPLVLYQINSEVSVGAISFYTRALDSGGFSHLYGPIAAFSDAHQWSFAGGMGLNESPLAHSAITAFFTIQITLEPSLQVTDLSFRRVSYSSLF